MHQTCVGGLCRLGGKSGMRATVTQPIQLPLNLFVNMWVDDRKLLHVVQLGSTLESAG